MYDEIKKVMCYLVHKWGNIVDKAISKKSNENLLKKIKNFIGKDVKAQNESKKLIVVIILILILVIVYFSINALFYIPRLDFIESLFYVLFLAVFIGIFVMSYYCRSITTLWMFNISMIIWICCIVHMFGWNIGVQHFLMVLLTLYFFSSYKQYAGKILYAGFLCCLCILLFYIYHYKEPLWPLSAGDENILQIINTITIFGCISIISFIFSNSTQELESKLINYNAMLEKQANTDALTGLYNRRKAMEYMDYLTNKHAGHLGFCLCICDIDFFKNVNDNYGHDFGDEVLKGISRIFMEEMKKGNFVARWGGEEFLLLFPECNGDEACIKLEKIRKRIKEMRIKKDDFEVSVTMTFGLSEYDYMNGLTATLREADEKLYIGKQKGRDRIVF